MFKYAVIYAGGEGTRMLPLTQYIPKGLIQIKGKSLIDYVIDFLRQNGIEQIYVTYSYKSEQILTHLKDKVNGFINTTNKDNSYFLYNSFIKYINEPVICMPCDIIVDINLKKVYKNFLELHSPVHSIIPVNVKKGISGDYITASNNIITKLDRKKNTGIYASGVQIINPYSVNKLTKAEDNFSNVWNQLISQKQLHLLDIKPDTWQAYDNIKDIL
jgi:NDP-sugar pyrophosphorylase family protein